MHRTAPASKLLDRERDLRHQVPRLEFIGANRFSGIVLINPNSQSLCATEVGLLGLDQALKGINTVIRKARRGRFLAKESGGGGSCTTTAR